MREGRLLGLREFLKTRVVDAHGVNVGHVQDLAVSPRPPGEVVDHLGLHLFWTDRVGAVELARRAEDVVVLVPWSLVAEIRDDAVVLRCDRLEIPAETAGGKTLVRRDVLDKQMLDGQGNRLQRVDDVLLRMDCGVLEVVGLEVSAGSLIAASRLKRYVNKLKRPAHAEETRRVIPWAALLKVERDSLVIGDGPQESLTPPSAASC